MVWFQIKNPHSKREVNCFNRVSGWMLLAVILTILISACSSSSARSPGDLPYQSISQNTIPHSALTGETYHWISVLTSTADISKLGQTITDQDWEKLRQVNFSQDFVIAIYHLQESRDANKVSVARISRKDQTIQVFIDFTGTTNPVGEIVPYQLIKMSRQGKKGVITFEVVANQRYLDVTEAQFPPIQPGTSSPTQENLPYEVLGSLGGGEEGPRINVLTDKSQLEVHHEVSSIDRKTVKKINETDFDKNFIVIVYQGIRPRADFSVNVTQVLRKDQTVYVYADFNEIGGRSQSISLADQVIRVQKGALHDAVQFVLVDNSRQVSQTQKDFGQ